MKNTPILLLGMSLAFWLGNPNSAAMAANLKAGDPAPDFNLPGSDGQSYQLSDFKGKEAVVIAWFPKAFTGG